MGLAEALHKMNKSKPEICAYQILYLSLNDDDRKALDNAWANDVPARVILRALRAENHKTSNEAISAHRSGNCRCKKE